jgi:hypothetical protein
MKDDHVAFDKTSVYLEIISFMVLFLKHAEKATDTSSSPVSIDEQDTSIILYEAEHIAINTDYPVYDNVIYNNNVNHNYNIIYNNIDYLNTTFGADQAGSIGPMDGG